jgi:hypothetical protein
MKEKNNGVDGSQVGSVQETEIKLAFLTGRVVQFVTEIALNEGVSPNLLADRISNQLGNGQGGELLWPEDTVSPLPSAKSKTHPASRKVAMARRPRLKLSGPKKVAIRTAIVKGMSINAAAKKYHVAWKTAETIGNELGKKPKAA